MTLNPRTVDRQATLEAAHEIMRHEGIRHLPVVDQGRLVGIVSQRDLHLMETLKDVDPDQVQVHEAMIAHAYVCAPQTPLEEVIAEMAESKIGAAVVMQDAQVIGVFTTIDAMRAFSEFLKQAPADATGDRERDRRPRPRPANATANGDRRTRPRTRP